MLYAGASNIDDFFGVIDDFFFINSA
jgi:hypothetical protein